MRNFEQNLLIFISIFLILFLVFVFPLIIFIIIFIFHLIKTRILITFMPRALIFNFCSNKIIFYSLKFHLNSIINRILEVHILTKFLRFFCLNVKLNLTYFFFIIERILPGTLFIIKFCITLCFYPLKVILIILFYLSI